MYHVGRNGQQTGPFSIEQLKAMVERGELQPTDLVWKEGMSGWEPASTVPGIFSSGPMPVVTSQPAAPFAQSTVLPPTGVQIPNYLVWSILSTLCCCIPFGIVAIVFSAQVNSKLAAGDVAGARASSDKAKLWCWVAFGTGLVVNIVGAIAQAMMTAAANHQ